MVENRIRFVTGNFYQLQGLRLVPLGLFLLFAGAHSQGWLDWLPGRPVERPGDLGNAWWPLALFAALVGAWWASDYYKCHYGSVTQFERKRRNWLLSLAIVGFLVLTAIDRMVTGPVLFAPLLISVSLLITVFADGWLRAHYLISAAAWLAVSVAPAIQPSESTIRLSYALIGGLTLLVCGVGDHIVIVRTFSKAREPVSAGESEMARRDAQDTASV